MDDPVRADSGRSPDSRQTIDPRPIDDGKRPMGYLRRFAAFLYDFLVGDAWELFVGPIVILILAWLAVTAGMAGWLAGVGLVVGMLIVAGISVAAGLRQAR